VWYLWLTLQQQICICNKRTSWPLRYVRSHKEDNVQYTFPPLLCCTYFSVFWTRNPATMPIVVGRLAAHTPSLLRVFSSILDATTKGGAHWKPRKSKVFLKIIITSISWIYSCYIPVNYNPYFIWSPSLTLWKIYQNNSS